MRGLEAQTWRGEEAGGTLQLSPQCLAPHLTHGGASREPKEGLTTLWEPKIYGQSVAGQPGNWAAC